MSDALAEVKTEVVRESLAILTEDVKSPVAYVLLSGGIDSTTCVADAVRTFGSKSVRCVSIDYGQRHSRELIAAKAIAQYYGRPHMTLPVFIPNTMLTNPDIEVPDISYDEIKGVSPTYVPFRNGLFLSTLASMIAGYHFDPSKKDDVDYNRDAVIFWGAHAEDAAGNAYPDCTMEFAGAMANAIYIGTYFKLRLITPFIHMMKDQIIRRGKELGVPYYLTFSCYKGGEIHCGSCSTCYARAAAFIRAGVEDPTEYISDMKLKLKEIGVL